MRDGMKSIVFLLASLACFVLVGLIGRALPPSVKTYVPNALLIAGLGLLLSLAAVRLERRSLASIGLPLDARFLRPFGLGLLAGALLVAASSALVCGLTGVELVRIDAPSAATLSRLLIVVLAGALFEELLFRGYAFQRAVSGIGRWPAIALFSLLFSVAHLPGNLELEPSMLLIAIAGLVLDCVIQSLLLLRSGSLALPIGLHFAWNLLQQSLGFGVSGLAASAAWFRADAGAQPGWLTGGDYGLEASVLSLAVQLPVLLWLLTAVPRQPRGRARAGLPA